MRHCRSASLCRLRLSSFATNYTTQMWGYDK